MIPKENKSFFFFILILGTIFILHSCNSSFTQVSIQNINQIEKIKSTKDQKDSKDQKAKYNSWELIKISDEEINDVQSEIDSLLNIFDKNDK